MFHKLASYAKMEFVQYQLRVYLNCKTMNVFKRVYDRSSFKFICTKEKISVKFILKDYYDTVQGLFAKGKK